MAEVRARFFDGFVIRIQLGQEIRGGETGGGQLPDYFLNLGGDYVAGGELGILEEVAHEPLSEQPCWISISSDLFAGKIGVEGGLAEGDELGEGGFEVPVLLVGFFDVIAE